MSTKQCTKTSQSKFAIMTHVFFKQNAKFALTILWFLTAVQLCG